MATRTMTGTPVHANTRFYKGRSLSGGPGCPASGRRGEAPQTGI